MGNQQKPEALVFQQMQGRSVGSCARMCPKQVTTDIILCSPCLQPECLHSAGAQFLLGARQLAAAMAMYGPATILPVLAHGYYPPHPATIINIGLHIRLRMIRVFPNLSNTHTCCVPVPYVLCIQQVWFTNV